MTKIFWCVIVIWLQGSLLSQAQDANTNSSTTPQPSALIANWPSTNSPGPAPAGTNAAPAAASPADNTPATFNKALELFRLDKQDEALSMLNAVLEKDPKNLNAYILRAEIYGQKQTWDKAQKDFEAALQLDTTNDGVRYDLADLKFKQKQFDDARMAFLHLPENQDREIRDLIQYKIFLCDLLGGHDDAAAQELAVFNKAGSNPSYYFGNAAWDLVHKKPEDARSWLVSATNIYPPRKHLLYVSMLKEMGYLPLPPTSDLKQ